MNLHEQISRTKTLMGIEPLNEGFTTKSGSFKDLFMNIFKKKPNESELSPIQTKYGNISLAPAKVESLNLVLKKQEDSNFNQDSVFITIIYTEEPQPLPSDSNKKVTQENYSVRFQETVNNQEIYRTYFKTLYLIDNQLSDFGSQVTENNNDTCASFSWAGGTEQCQLPQELKDVILEKFKNDKEIGQLTSFLDRIK